MTFFAFTQNQIDIDVLKLQIRTIKLNNAGDDDVRNSPTIQVLHETYITKTRPCNIQLFFTSVKMTFFGKFFFLLFSYFCSKHRLWVHVRTASPRRF